ncbi:MAG: hypothetical protein ABIO91_03760 [Pyrinomonadaceae bacterium]
MIGRSMNTHAEEEWKGEYWWREFILGTPGYYRASTIVVGFAFILIGAIGVLHSLFFS